MDVRFDFQWYLSNIWHIKPQSETGKILNTTHLPFTPGCNNSKLQDSSLISKLFEDSLISSSSHLTFSRS